MTKNKREIIFYMILIVVFCLFFGFIAGAIIMDQAIQKVDEVHYNLEHQGYYKYCPYCGMKMGDRE